MTVIEISNHNELPQHISMHCVVACCNVEEAARIYQAKYGRLPETAYFKRDKSGKCSVYIPLED